MSTAQIKKQELEDRRIQLVALGFQIQREKSHFRYPDAMIQQQTNIHNEIIRLRTYNHTLEVI